MFQILLDLLENDLRGSTESPNRDVDEILKRDESDAERRFRLVPYRLQGGEELLDPRDCVFEGFEEPLKIIPGEPFE